MQTEQQKDTLKKEVKDVQAKNKKEMQEFVKLQDITKEMFNDLQIINVKLSHTTTRSGYPRDTIYFEIHEMLPITIQIKTTRYNVLRMKLGLPLKDKLGKPRTEYNLQARVRFVKGENEIREYKSVELIFAQFVYEIYFINDYNELQLLEMLEKNGELKIDWLTRPDKISESETINSTWE